MAPNTKNTDIKKPKAMSPQKKVWLSLHKHHLLQNMRDEEEGIAGCEVLRILGLLSAEQKLGYKFMVAKKAFWICSHNGDIEGCHKWYEKAKKRGLEFMDAVGDITDQHKVLCFSIDKDDETRDDWLAEEGQDNAYMLAGKSLKSAVNNMEYVLKNMPN